MISREQIAVQTRSGQGLRSKEREQKADSGIFGQGEKEIGQSVAKNLTNTLKDSDQISHV